MLKLLKLLFPEYKVVEIIREKGFWAKDIKNKQKNKVSHIINGTQVRQEVASNELNQVFHNSTDNSINHAKLIKNHITKHERKRLLDKKDDIFDKLLNNLSKYWIGTSKDYESLIYAFKRPYVSGTNGEKPKNTILVLGTESRGKVYAIQCISALLKQNKVFKHSEVAIMDMREYKSDTYNDLFMSDLYKSLHSQTEAIIFENIEVASLTHLDVLYQLISKGEYQLSKRYMERNNSLVDATGILDASLVKKISAEGKFFILTSTCSESKVVSTLGTKVINLLGDLITLDPISDKDLKKLAYTLIGDIINKCKTNLNINLTFDDNIVSSLVTEYSVKSGVKGLVEYIDTNIYKPLSEIKLKQMISDEANLVLNFDDSYYIQKQNNQILRLSSFFKTFNKSELKSIKEELAEIIGLQSVKTYVLDLEKNLEIKKLRERKGQKVADISMHMIFSGNPGTGKTTIARIVAKYLKAIGVLSSGHLCEVTRSDLVGQYVGHTSEKTRNVIQSALGGVLFIDEAYSLCRDEHDTFGREAVDELVKGIEDNRDNLVVILAGYDNEMEAFLKTNPGLKSRFPNNIHFDDYTSSEMYVIAQITAKSKGYKLSSECEQGMLELFDKSQIKGRNDIGNGRLVRNIIEAAILQQGKRILDNPNSDIEILIPQDFDFNKKFDFDLEKELSDVIGMETVKSIIRQQYAVLQANKKRRDKNILVDTSQAFNMIFSGNPGTGKTMMARIMANMFKSMGVLKSGQLIETDKSGLVASYVGQTSKKTEEIFKSALGGILFIDEAYSIANDKSGFGQECIDTLVKLIEDYHGEIIVILAGYAKEMKEFLKSNSGLESRFPLIIDFPDYSVHDLLDIGKCMITSRGFILSSAAEVVFEEEIAVKKHHATTSSGNARMIRNFVEEIIRKQSERVVFKELTNEDLITIESNDIKSNNTNSKQFDLEKTLSGVVGLESVKTYIRSLNARLLIQAERKKRGVADNSTQTMHMIFKGNPGTGKTMMARTIADVLFNMNVIRTNKLIEIDRSGLVAGYVGQTAIKTEEVIESALDGVLFIDEAYALAQGGENDFGQEAIDKLVKMMDDYRDRLVVILAGYSDDMDYFLQKNAGLKSRFPNIIDFSDYTTDELMHIAFEFYYNQGYILTTEAQDVLKDKIKVAKENTHFGNGRYVRNVFEKSLNNQALRLSVNDDITTEALITITADDIRSV